MDATQADLKTLRDERDDLAIKLNHEQQTVRDLRQKVATLERAALLMTDQARLLEQKDVLIEALRRALKAKEKAAANG